MALLIRVLLPAVLVALVLAGCSGASPASVEVEAVGVVEVPPDEPGAELEGMVVNDQLEPVAHAIVALLERESKKASSQTVTDEAGHFDLGRVAVGQWILVVSALGYESHSRTVAIADGEDQLEVRLTLEPIPVAEAYFETYIRSLTITFGFGWSVGGGFNDGCIAPGVTCQAIGYPNPQDKFKTDDPEQAPLATIVFEETWIPNSAACAKAIAVDIYNPDAPSTGNPSFSNPHYWTNSPSKKWSEKSPVVMVIPRFEEGNADAIDSPERVEQNGGDTMRVKGDWTVRNFPPGGGFTGLAADFNCFTDQKFNLYFSHFYLDPAPLGFSAQPDA